MAPKQLRSNRFPNYLLGLLVGVAVLAGCLVCGTTVVLMNRNEALYRTSQTRVAAMPPTETALPLPTATVRSTSVPTPTATLEPVIVDVSRLLETKKADVIDYLGQPWNDDPIKDTTGFAVGGTSLTFSPVFEGHELFIMMDFDRDEIAVSVAIAGLDPWGIPLNEWKRIAERLRVPFAFDDTFDCQTRFLAGEFGRTWEYCHGYLVSFFADSDTSMINAFQAQRTRP